MSGAVLTRAERIARLNDSDRPAMGIFCGVVASEGVRTSPEVDPTSINLVYSHESS